jgi:hypothetical protein
VRSGGSGMARRIAAPCRRQCPERDTVSDGRSTSFLTEGRWAMSILIEAYSEVSNIVLALRCCREEAVADHRPITDADIQRLLERAEYAQAELARILALIGLAANDEPSEKVVDLAEPAARSRGAGAVMPVRKLFHRTTRDAAAAIIVNGSRTQQVPWTVNDIQASSSPNVPIPPEDLAMSCSR